MGDEKMIINGVPIKKYRARVRDRNTFTTLTEPVSADGYKVVEGYISIAAVVLPDGQFTPTYVPVFVAEEVNFHSVRASGFGKSVFNPSIYEDGEFELLEEV